MSTTELRRPARAGRGLRSATQLLEVNAELGTATVRVDIGEVTEATVQTEVTAQIVTAARLAVNALMGQVSRSVYLDWTSVSQRATWT